MKYFYLLASLILFFNSLPAQSSAYPKREFRGTWLSTVYNLDWPTTKGNVATQKTELTTLLDSLKSAGINAVFFQVRTACDALYNSPYEPWSYWLTGTQGTAPSPLYDPLEFAIDEAHKRGMELHAWFNPYRAVEGSAALSSSHVVNQHPEWILTVGSGSKKILNPGLQSVRDYNIQIISDVVTRYDIDGVHFDDYFYPYSPNNITTEDNATFTAYPRGFSNIADWRRDNINIFIHAVNSAIKSIKPYVKFGISPFGIWKSGTPSGITGTSAYSTLYCDAIKWLQDGSVDYITPQLYWKIGGSQDYDALQNWWADQASTYGRHFYPGQQFTSGYTNGELPAQIRINRKNSKTGGNVLFRSEFIQTNNLTLKDSLKGYFFKYPALMPVMSWIDNTPPNTPSDFSAVNSSGQIELTWSLPAAAGDGDAAKKFVIYRSKTSPVDISDAANILAITVDNGTQYSDNTASLGNTYYYKITALDKCSNESAASSEVSIIAAPGNTAIADFESGTGVFSRVPTYSGSTKGVSTASTSSRVTTTSYKGSASFQIVLKDNSSSVDDWAVRLLSGDGTPANNTAISATGYVGFWMKTSTAPAGAKLAITLDDAAGGTEISAKQDVINDGQWHLYQYALPGSGWTSFAGGNGSINGPTVTIDALMFYAPNASPDWTFYIDEVSFNNSAPLPVELSSFTAIASARSVKLDWSTSTELNNHGFGVERATSDYPGDWQNIAFVQGHGNSNSPIDYSFTDMNVSPSVKYLYRLRQTDFDGSVKYSPVAEATCSSVQAFELLQNYPNPFNPSTTISYSIPVECSVRLTVFDALGQQVASLVNSLQGEGLYNVQWNAGNIASGFYFYRIDAQPVNASQAPYISVKKLLLVK